MSLKLPIYRRDVNDRTTNLVDQRSLRNIHEHDHEGLGREPMNKMNEPSSPSKRHARFELDLAANIESACCAQNTIHNVKHSSQLREKKVSTTKHITLRKHVINQWFPSIATRPVFQFGQETALASIGWTGLADQAKVSREVRGTVAAGLEWQGEAPRPAISGHYQSLHAEAEGGKARSGVSIFRSTALEALQN